MSDFISREVALDRIRDYIEEYSWHTDEHGFHSPEWCAMKEAEMVLTDLPAADVRPVVRGRWIDTDNYYQRWKCSACGCHTRDAAPSFCPNCGAKMEES
jgi:rubrerythrin